MSTEKGMKHDNEKPRMDLFSTIWLDGVSRVLAFGAKKYAADNWRKEIERRRLIGAALRHITSYNAGEDNDPETGLSHLYHASCCIMFASELHFTQPLTDDRFKEIKILGDLYREAQEKLAQADGAEGGK